MKNFKNKKGLQYWKQAKKLIPGGNSILSKRPERYAPDIWPTYYSKAKGCYVWDLNGEKYIDMAQMGMGSSMLGYCNSEVDHFVKKAIDKGINTTLNATEEVKLAEKLIKLNKFSGGVKFSRTGGEAMSIAVRIARSFTNNKTIAFSGYHGWHDWYLATNLSNKNNLNKHLLPGLTPKGVLKELEGTIFPFTYNNVDDFKNVLNKNKNIGIVIVEGARYEYPNKKFVESINKEIKKRKLILIVDEITSGFRASNSGTYAVSGLKPDIVVYGKGLGNGYAISAIVGKKNIMQAAQDSFISSLNWSERIGFVAAIKTLEIISRDKTWKHIKFIGKLIKQGWLRLSERHNINLKVTDFEPLITMKFNYGHLNKSLETFFTQEMLKKKYLASTSVYVSTAHSKKIIEVYLKNCDQVFKKMRKLMLSNRIKQNLETRTREDGFKRLT